MSLKKNIEADIKQAMLSKDQDRLRALRGIKSMILLAETEKGGSGALSEDAEMKILTKAIKQRKDSFELYVDQGRQDLADKEKVEIDVINNYLPKQLSDAELEAELTTIISTLKASGPQDMGKVMGVATKKLAGQADGKTISQKVKSLLSQ